MPATVVPDQLCPYCGYHFNRASNVMEPLLPPKTGDIMICLDCGRPGLLNTDMTVRKPTPEEVQELLDTPEYQTHLAAWRHWNRLQRHGR